MITEVLSPKLHILLRSRPNAAAQTSRAQSSVRRIVHVKVSQPLSLNTSTIFRHNYLLISSTRPRLNNSRLKFTNRSFRYASFCLWKQLFPIISSATSSSFTHTFTAFSRSISSLQFSPTATADSNVSVCLSHAGIAPSRAKAGS